MHAKDQPILLVEDSPEDQEVTIRALQSSGIRSIYHCSDGEQALDFLYRRGQYSDPTTAPRPGIILLDLNLPGTDGREVLAEVKQDPDLRSIPIVVLTTSRDQRDVAVCYRNGANSYMQKPVNLDTFNEAIHTLKRYWFESMELPPLEP